MNASTDEYDNGILDSDFEAFNFNGLATPAVLVQFTDKIFTEALMKVLQKLKSEK